MNLLKILGYRQKLIVFLLGFALIPFLLFTFFYFKVTLNTSTSEVLQGAGSLLDRSIENVNNIYAGSYEKMLALDNNYQLQYYLNSDYYADTRELGGKFMEVMEFYDNLKMIHQVLKAGNPKLRIRIYAVNEGLLASELILKLSDLNPTVYQSVLKNEKNILWKFDLSNENDTKKGEYLYLYKKNMTSSNQLYAIEEAQIDLKSIKEKFNFDMPEGCFILYVSSNRDVFTISSNVASKDTLSKAIQGYLSGKAMKGYHVIQREIKYNSDRVLMYIPKAFILKKYTSFFFIAAFVFLSLIVLIVFLVTYISKKLTQRLYRLMMQIDKDTGILQESDEVQLIEGDDEFARINSKFRELLAKIKESYVKEANYQTEKKALELELLQSLINPHFLYNTLDGIKWTYRDEKLSNIVDSMVKYYRVALNKGNKILKVSLELSMVEEYLKLQKFAYESDFRYTIDVEEGIMNCLIMKHLVQPIVENCVLHGIRKCGSEGLITIQGYRENQKIVFIIKDNGVGMDQERVDKILRGEYKGVQGGYGMMNIMKRIELNYGSEYGLVMTSAPNQGTTVTLTIPYIEPVSREAV